jgi:hypothetical protein
MELAKEEDVETKETLWGMNYLTMPSIFLLPNFRPMNLQSDKCNESLK